MSESLAITETPQSYAYTLADLPDNASLAAQNEQRIAWIGGVPVDQTFYKVGRITIPPTDKNLLRQSLTYPYTDHERAGSEIKEHPGFQAAQLIMAKLGTTFENLVLHDAKRRGLQNPQLWQTRISSGTVSHLGENMVWHIDELPTHAPYDFAARYAMTAIGANTEFAPGPLELNDISPDGELATIPTDLHPTTRKHLAAPRYLKNGEVALFPTHALHTEPQPNNEPRAFLTAWVIPPV